MKPISIGVDVGGSHISCMAYDLVSKKPMVDSFAKSVLHHDDGADIVISVWGSTIKKVIAKSGVDRIKGIGFAMPGPFDYDGGVPLFQVENRKYDSIYGLDVRKELNTYFNLKRDLEMRFINDATAFAIGEQMFGKGKNAQMLLCVTLGTGFGSAFIKNGLPVINGTGIPEKGGFWHLSYEDGTVDDYFSARGLLKRYERATGKRLKGVEQIADLVTKHEKARQLFDDLGSKMGLFLASWIKKSGTEVIVFGGNISRAFHAFGPSLQNVLHDYGLSVKIFASDLKETASFIGAASLLDDSFYQKVLPIIHKM